MKRVLVLAASLAVSAGMALADPVLGEWRTPKLEDGNSGTVKIKTCGSKICGIIGQSYDPSGQPFKSENTGKRVVWDMVPAGDGSYHSGKIWNPATDKTYKSKMSLEGNKLYVSGCIAGGLLCKKQTWTRIK